MIILVVFLFRKEQTDRPANIFLSVPKGYETKTIVLLIVSKVLQQQENKHKDETILFVTIIYHRCRNPYGMRFEQCSHTGG
ncbi:hypothetical protein, partial [Porphyromonas gulae]|uniref:hypothetical protein n=1 Tax=Porphyromonas gulae TaxID=111105 RepID=UPI0024320E75